MTLDDVLDQAMRPFPAPGGLDLSARFVKFAHPRVADDVGLVLHLTMPRVVLEARLSYTTTLVVLSPCCAVPVHDVCMACKERQEPRYSARWESDGHSPIVFLETVVENFSSLNVLEASIEAHNIYDCVSALFGGAGHWDDLACRNKDVIKTFPAVVKQLQAWSQGHAVSRPIMGRER